MPIYVLQVVLYAQSASSNFNDQYFLELVIGISKIFYSSLFETSTWPFV